MFSLRSKLVALALGVATAGVSYAQDSGPLIDLLVRKGIINDQEAEELRAELVRDFAANTSAGKLNLSSSLTELRLSGDVRARYEERSGELTGTDNHQERGRFRYRVRAGLTGRVLNDWGFGLRLETGSGSRSTNVTMGADGGPSAKSDDGLFVGQIYATYTPSPKFSAIIGRMPNPLVTTSMMWDGDINPEGIAEQFRIRDDNIEYFGTFGQFLYAGSNTRNAFSAANVNDVFLFAWQGGVKVHTGTPGGFFQIAPTIYHHLGADESENPAAFRGPFTASNPGGINNLFVIDVPMEYNWLIGDKPARLFADVAVNLDAGDRARKWGRADLDGENLAYTVGFQYGKAVNRGDWDARIAWQSIDLFALDANLVDSDLFDSRTNMRGLILSGNYALGAATQFTVTLARGERVNDSVVAAGAGDIGSNNALDTFWLLQGDLNLKF